MVSKTYNKFRFHTLNNPLNFLVSKCIIYYINLMECTKYYFKMSAISGFENTNFGIPKTFTLTNSFRRRDCRNFRLKKF